MASTSASSVEKSFKYDVFLSFCGEDTRKGFVDHLYHALDRRGITIYKDNVRIEKGERIDDQLMTAIEESRYYIIVFSKNYAASSWCLKELEKIMECQKLTEHTAYPVFYDVEPTEVRHQSGAVGEAFAKHEKEGDVGRWRKALKEAADLAGMELKNTDDGHEAGFIEKLVKGISLKLHYINLSVDDELVGMKTRVMNVLKYLESGFNDVQMIGIKGMGGGGKTTLARAVFDQMAVGFEGKSFVHNVREVAKGFGLKELQKQILSEVLNDQSIDVPSVFDGKKMMKNMMGSRKVLLVLDDVDDVYQLEALAGEPSWFKAGSRIIVTTRDEQVLKKHQVNFIHDVSLLTEEEAICLFSRCAFKREDPILGYEGLSRKVVYYADGLPLTINVLGNLLCGRTKYYWEKIIKRLKTIPLKETLEKLELSYNGLEEEYQEIFLDVACILKGESKDVAIRILKSCGYNAVPGLEVLEERSLITVSDTGHLGLHDHIEEMGWNIVRRVDLYEPTKHSRLWVKEQIEDILLKGSGTEATKSIKLLTPQLSPDIVVKGLAKMKKLRLLYVDNGYQAEVYTSPSSYNDAGLPNGLRCVYWRGFPLSCLPKTFQAEKLVNLEMRESSISQLWEEEERKVLENLKFLDLKDSKLRTFDLGMTICIKTLDLSGCNDFVELNIPDELLKLKFLNLSGSKVSSLKLERAPNLVGLYLEECNDFVELHLPVECRKLKFLYITGLMARNLNLLMSPYVEKLENLERLILSINNIDRLPHSICMLKHLKCLKLKYCWLLKKLPEGICSLECLEELHLMDCRLLRDIPTSICKIKCLKSLHLPYIGVKKLPEELGCLECLKELNLEGARIRDLPESIYKLKGLCIVWSRGQLLRHGFRPLKEVAGYTASCFVV